MLSKEVVLALKGYCPQPIREGLVRNFWLTNEALIDLKIPFNEGEEDTTCRTCCLNHAVLRWKTSNQNLVPLSTGSVLFDADEN